MLKPTTERTNELIDRMYGELSLTQRVDVVTWCARPTCLDNHSVNCAWAYRAALLIHNGGLNDDAFVLPTVLRIRLRIAAFIKHMLTGRIHV